MNIANSLVTTVAKGVFCVSLLFPVVSLSAAAPSPGTAFVGEGSAILMGVATAAYSQTAQRQSVDRAALRQRLGYLIDRRIALGTRFGGDDNVSRIVRVVFDVGADGRTANVRVGKRSGNAFMDNSARQMIARFDGLPGGERSRVCAVLQYGHLGQDPDEATFVKALADARNAAIADLRMGRDGPDSDRHGHVVVG